MEETKVCTKCSQSKPLHEFAKDTTRTLSGYSSRCKECARQKVKSWYSNNKERKMKYTQQYQKDHYPAYKLKAMHRANHVYSTYAPPICMDCGEPGNKFHKHHPNYSYPEVVKWVCPKCHAKLRKTALTPDQPA